ncbi:MAG TPA: cytochrome c-type biogenesis protein [Alphaproteobacteria bacterium]|nr:cytochrome c-type biogenesis protein [Alphaproteobacteria bacterium]
MRALAALLMLVMVAAFVPAALAVEPNEVLKDPALEKRARNISKRLRCLVCQNQSIDDSNAGLARDLRVLVRERLTAGDSDKQVVGFVVARYGDFVLLRPPVNAATFVLWFGPLLILLLAGAGVFVFLRRRRPESAGAAARPLDAAEEKRLDALLADDGPGS